MNNIRVLPSSILIALVSVFSFISSGCSSTYHVSDFSSKENFYSDFNNFARGKNLKVTLKSDSTIFFKNGAVIKDDILFFPISEGNITDDFMPLNKVKEITYKNHWLGVPIYMGFEAIAGFFTGSIANSNSGNGTALNPGITPVLGGIVYAVCGTAIGAITGWFLGYNYTYYFNQ